MTLLPPAEQALLDVITVALSLMMCVQLFGQAWESCCRVERPKPQYECDFNMRGHVVTMPCEIRSVRYESKGE